MNHEPRFASEEMHECSLCGERSALHSIERQKFVYGDGADRAELEAQVPVWKCSSCGEQYLAVGAEEARHESVCRHLGRLTPKEIKQIRQQYGVSQEEFAKLTGIGPASIKRWESGALIQSESSDITLRLLTYKDNAIRLGRIRHTPHVITEHKFRTQISPEQREAAERFQLRRSIQLPHVAG